MNGAAKRVGLLGVLAALALALSFLEGLLPPLPMTPPGFKLGLSNIVSMFAAGSLGLPHALFLALFKGGFSFLTRGAAAGLMSLSGAALSALCTWALLTKTKLPFLLVGVAGAMAHNFAQLLCAWALTSHAALFYIPALLLFGTLSGLLTGTVLKLVLPFLERVFSNSH